MSVFREGIRSTYPALCCRTETRTIFPAAHAAREPSRDSLTCPLYRRLMRFGTTGDAGIQATRTRSEEVPLVHRWTLPRSQCGKSWLQNWELLECFVSRWREELIRRFGKLTPDPGYLTNFHTGVLTLTMLGVIRQVPKRDPCQRTPTILPILGCQRILPEPCSSLAYVASPPTNVYYNKGANAQQLNSVIPGDGLWGNVRIRDVMGTAGERLCSLYV